MNYTEDKDAIKPSIFTLFMGLFLVSNFVFAQKPLNPIKDVGPKSKIELIKADSLVGENSLTRSQTFLGHVIFSHNGTLLGCNKAIHNLSSNFIEAYGNVVINQGDTLTIVGDTLLYDGNTRYARVFGKTVTLRDKKVSLKTTKIFYDLNTSQAQYPVPGFLKQDSSTLTSKQGYYNTKSRLFNYIGDVEIMNPSYVICTDTLDYDANGKMAIFKTFTTIRSKNGDISAYKGKYNIKTKVSKLEGRARVSNADFILEGDTLNFDNINDKGDAKGKVVFVSFKDTLISAGKYAYRNGKIGITKIIGNTFTQKINKVDTMLLVSDSLWIYEVPKAQKKDTSATPKKEDILRIRAIKNVRVYKADFQSYNDSLLYDLEKDKIYYYKKPVIWNNQNQLEADTITIILKENRLDLMQLRVDCFVVQVDTISNYNQIKGRKMDTQFGEQQTLKNINVLGNGESCYTALDEKNRFIGLNRVQCSAMRFDFKDRKIEQIVFKGKPESLLIPPKEISKEDLFLENFEWKDKIRPRKLTLMKLPEAESIRKFKF